MIIQILMNILYSVLNVLLVLDIPSLPTEVHSYITSLFDYITAGAGILANYTPLSYLLTLFFVLLAVDAGIMVYHFIMWIIKKIPMLSMS